MKSFNEFITEDIDVSPYVSRRRSGGRARYTQANRDLMAMKKPKALGRIEGHPEYSVWWGPNADDPENTWSKEVVIIDRKKNTRAGRMTMLLIKGGEQGEKESWSINWAEVNPKYSSKKIGFSVMSAAYERMADSGVNIESDTTQSPGGASIWKRLLRNKKNKVHAVDDRKISRSPIKGMKDENDIWWTPEAEKEADKRLERLDRISDTDAERLKYYSQIEKEENRKEKIAGRSLLLKGKKGVVVKTAEIKNAAQSVADRKLKPKAREENKTKSNKYKSGEVRKTSSGWGAKSLRDVLAYFTNKEDARRWSQSTRG
jgi:hypothetical protein